MFWENIQQLDEQLFKAVNIGCDNEFFNVVLPFVRQSIVWLPLYVFLIYLSFVKLGYKAWWWILAGLITVTISDQVSSNFIKNWVQRPRPCNTEDVLMFLKLRVKQCSGGYSFTSSHATNHFAFAYFLCNTLGKNYFPKWLTIAFFSWALTIGFAQVYVGVHYPADVLCGSILGVCVGHLGAVLFRFAYKKVNSY